MQTHLRCGPILRMDSQKPHIRGISSGPQESGFSSSTPARWVESPALDTIAATISTCLMVTQAYWSTRYSIGRHGGLEGSGNATAARIIAVGTLCAPLATTSTVRYAVAVVHEPTSTFVGTLYSTAVSFAAAVADAAFGAGILPFLQWLVPWVGICLTFTTIRIVWQVKTPEPVAKEWKWSMIATGLGLGFLSSALCVQFFPGREGLQFAIVGAVALFPDRFLRILIKVFDQLEEDPFGFIRRLRSGDPEK